MTIEKRTEHTGVDVHFDPDECELFMKLASDAEKVSGGHEAPALCPAEAQSYFSLSVALGKRIRTLEAAEATIL